MRQGYISFVGTCYFYFMVIKPFLHAQALTEHAKKKKKTSFQNGLKILGEKILLSIRLPLEREKTIKHRQHYTLCNVFMETEGFAGGSAGKESAAMREIPVRFLGREDPLEKGMATHSSILAWRIPWTV